MREDGTLFESKAFRQLASKPTLKVAADRLRAEVAEGLELMPADIRQALEDRGWRVVLRSKASEIIKPKPGESTSGLDFNVFGAFRVIGGDVSCFLKPTVLKRHFSGAHTLLHEAAHAADHYLEGARPGMSHSMRRWFINWHLRVSRDGSLRQALKDAGTPGSVERYIAAKTDEGYDPITTKEAWAEVLAHVWVSQDGRALFAARFPGIVSNMEQEIRDELKLWD